MEDIELVIKIPKGLKEALDNAKKENAFNYIRVYDDTFYNALKNGTPLPKGHGRIKDIDKIEWYGCTSELDCPHKNRECKDCDRAECSKTQVDGIPTIIEADKERKMNRKFCDRCGKEINTNPIVQCQNPLFEIKQIYPRGMMPIDLCEDCSKKFVEWVRRNDDGNEH